MRSRTVTLITAVAI